MLLTKAAKQQALVRLDRVVQGMPAATAAAMLSGLDAADIWTGAYAPHGVPGAACPMLAALRAGAPARHVPFAKAWDAWCEAVARDGLARPRRATRHEIAVLRSMLGRRLFPAAERRPDGRCLGCGRREIHDLHGACACCAWRPPRADSGPDVLLPAPGAFPATVGELLAACA